MAAHRFRENLCVDGTRSLREIQTKGKEARFKKTDRGLFALNR